MSHGNTNPRGLRREVVLLALVAAGLAFGSVGCDPDHDHDRDQGYAPDWRAPDAPRGLWSMTGDEEVSLMWIANTEDDLAGYRIYRSLEPHGYFPRVATVGPSATRFNDHEVTNGTTYYYVISAFDWSGNEGDLSSQPIHDTPRPEGTGVRLNNARTDAEDSGFDFSQRRAVDYREIEADVYFWQSDDEGAWMIATERSADSYTDIQDAGYVDLEDVDWAPAEGWATQGEVPLIVGHSYIVWTWDNHYAKFRVASVNPDRVIFDWAYQTDEGNPELFAGKAAAKRGSASERVHQKGIQRRVES